MTPRAQRERELCSVPRLLAPSEAGAELALREVYRDKLATCLVENAFERLFSIEDALGARAPRDPELTGAALAAFGPDPANWTASTATPDGVPVELALQHDRVLPALAAWTHGRPGTTLVHVDAHSDLESPAMSWTGEPLRWHASVGDALLGLGERETLEAFIRRGMVGIGGFLVPLLAAERCERIVFVRDSPDQPPRVRRMRVCRRMLLTFAGTAHRAVLTDDPAGPIELVELGSLRALSAWLSTHRGSLLVDLDCDYWVNAYDDSLSAAPALPDTESLAARIGSDVGWIVSLTRAHPVLGWSVAFSPDFFPVRFWRVAARAIGERLGLSPRVFPD